MQYLKCFQDKNSKSDIIKSVIFAGLVDCLNDEDCLGADRICFRNTTMHVGKCICQDGYKPAKEDPIKCLNIGKLCFLENQIN